MCARIEGANREISGGKTDIRPRGLSVFFYVLSQQGAAAATERYFRGFGRVDISISTYYACSRASFTNSGPRPPWAGTTASFLNSA